MPTNELLQQKIELEEQIKVLKITLTDIKAQMASTNCPFKVGDIMQSQKLKKRAIINRITYDEYPPGYNVHGQYILKSGRPGKRSYRLYDWDEWHKEAQNADK